MTQGVFALGDEGFSLAEALMALLIVSLALGGLLQASRMIGQTEPRLAGDKQTLTVRTKFQNEMRDRLSPLQPILGKDIVGEAATVHYPCEGGDCTLAAPEGQLVYLTDGTAHNAWPPVEAPNVSEPNLTPPRLEAILWRDARGKNLAVIKFPVEHSRDCLFDMITRACLPASLAIPSP